MGEGTLEDVRWQESKNRQMSDYGQSILLPINQEPPSKLVAASLILYLARNFTCTVCVIQTSSGLY